MVTSWWRKQRVWGMESARIQYQVKMNEAMGRVVPVDDPATRTALAVGDLADNSRALDLYLRYETRYERQFHRALHRLLDLRSRYPKSDDDSPSANTNLPNDPEQPIENTPQPLSGSSGSVGPPGFNLKADSEQLDHTRHCLSAKIRNQPFSTTKTP